MIVSALQYQLLINMNLTLLEYDKDTNLVTLLAEDYEVKGNSIVFQIKKGIKTFSGHEIKGIDAEVSLKRLILSSGSHSRLSELLCPENDSKTCPGISSKDYELILVARKKSYIPFILSLLTNADNVIFPTTALSSFLPDSEITNLRETTGPYFIDSPTVEDKDVSNFKLVINKTHFLYNSMMAKEVLYNVANYDDLLINRKLKNEFNYIHNVSGLKLEDIKTLESTTSNVAVFSTSLIKNTMIFSTQKGKSEFGKQATMFYGLAVRNALLASKSFSLGIEKPQVEYFPVGSEGQLKANQLQEVEETYLNALKNYKASGKRIRLGIYGGMSFDKQSSALKNIENLDIVKISNSPLENNNENVDLFIDTIDSSFTESLDLLEYNKTFEIFDISDENMKNYINSESKDERIQILREIHYRSLMQARFINIGVSAYSTVLEKSWDANPSSYFVGFPVWKIIKKKY